eukprot:GAHX01001694.1.p1 GENE.GAHX01001694.1~~GAHX01001694.1.p1  ORF type:complete len:200 (-),score=28.94 GAHX01001694.1:305-904(-)
MEHLLSFQSILDVLQETSDITAPLKSQNVNESIKGRLADLESIFQEIRTISETNTLAINEPSSNSQNTLINNEKSSQENSDASYLSDDSQHSEKDSNFTDKSTILQQNTKLDEIPEYCTEEKYTTLPDYYKKAFTFEEFNVLIHKIRIKEEFAVDGLSRETFVNTIGEKGESLLGGVIHLDLITGVYTKEGIKYKLQSR